MQRDVVAELRGDIPAHRRGAARVPAARPATSCRPPRRGGRSRGHCG
jgi:hypothetical protein